MNDSAQCAQHSRIWRAASSGDWSSFSVPESRRAKSPTGDEKFPRDVGAQETRMLRARHRGVVGLWSGFGLFGVIGWSVAAPTLLGVLLGTWLDKHRPGAHSWTLSLLIAGLSLGCANAWYWVARQSQEIRANEENDD